MGVRVLESRDGKMAALYDSGSMWAFGPVLESVEKAQAFLDWLTAAGKDPRIMQEGRLETLYMDWRQATDGE